MAARWNLLMTSSVCLVLCSLCITEQSSEDRGAMLQVGRQVFEYNDHTYTFHYERSVTWEEARSICARESKGSYLAVIEDMDEAEFVAGAMAGSLNNFVFLQDVWIGGHYVTDRWIWDATGDVIPGMDGYPPWGLSAGRRGMDCLLLGRLLWNRPTFQEIQCNRRRSFLCEIGCIRLSNNDRGHWEPAYCAEQAGEMGYKCKFVCNPEYQHSGSDVIECTGVGWNGTGGFGILPKCISDITPEELGEDLAGQIKDTLSDLKKTGFLFLKDNTNSKIIVSRYEFQTDLKNYKTLTTYTRTNANESAHTFTFRHSADVDIHLGANDNCVLNDLNDKPFIDNYSEIDSVAEDFLRSYNGHSYNLAFVVWEEMNTTSQSPFADKLKSIGQIEFKADEDGYYGSVYDKDWPEDYEGPQKYFAILTCRG